MADRPLPQKVVEGLPTKSAKIRALDDAGYERTEIAKFLDIRYQHVRNVLVDRDLKEGGPITPRKRAQVTTRPAPKKLMAATLVEGGFERSGRWIVEDDSLKVDGTLPDQSGVYAFAVDDQVMYIGMTIRSIRKRLYFYGRPGPSQKTNQRINPIIRAEIKAGRKVDILTATPGKTEWKGLLVDMVPGLETALLREYQTPWNRRG